MAENHHNKGIKLPPEPLTTTEVRALLAACSTRAPTGIRNRALLVTLWRARAEKSYGGSRGGAHASRCRPASPGACREPERSCPEHRGGPGQVECLASIEPAVHDRERLGIESKRAALVPLAVQDANGSALAVQVLRLEIERLRAS